MDNFAYTTDLSDPVSNGIHLNDVRRGISAGKKARSNSAGPKRVVSVLGSGDYGRAISARLVRSGYSVFIGSRDPNRMSIKNLVRQTGATLVNQEAAIASSDVILVAVGRDYYDQLPTALLKGKLLIDVSNSVKYIKGPAQRSNAEYLQALVPEAHVVKCFNVLSAYTLESGLNHGSKEVYYAGDNSEAKNTVAGIVRAMGFTPVDYGSLRASRDIENIPLHLMPSWKRPVAVTFGIFLFLWILALLSFQICANVGTGDWTKNWENISLVNFNRVLGIHSLWMLSFCYLPGLIAAYAQLWRGSKYSRFPKWLDDWLKMRKQLGLLMMGTACLHGCLSVAFITPKSTEWIYEAPTMVELDVVTGDTTEKQIIPIYNHMFNWRGQLTLTLGALALCLTIVLGITSLPSVTATLTWREFTFIQSKLGWVAMIIACLHDIFLAWKFMFMYWSCFNSFPIGPQYALYPPLLCVALKLPLLFPPVDNYLQKIRRGYERTTSLALTNKEAA